MAPTKRSAAGAKRAAMTQKRAKRKPSQRKVWMPPPAPAPEMPVIPDRRAMEATLASIGSMFGKRGDAVSKAQKVMYKAWAAETLPERVKLAGEALDISPDCADAYNLLAEHAPSGIERLDCYLQGMHAGERALGTEPFREDVGHFWGILETRPYMRARFGLAMTLDSMGEHEEAADQYRELLRLNPNDNQGVREELVGLLFDIGTEDELFDLLNTYGDSASAEWTFTWALAQFRKEGDTDEARRLLKVATKYNEHVPAYLLRNKREPANAMPGYMTFGGETEAHFYAKHNKARWRAIKGALGWLKQAVDQ